MKPTVLVLTSSMLTDRMVLWTSLLERLLQNHRVVVWSTAHAGELGEDLPEGVEFEPFPADRDFAGGVDRLRLVNDLAWVRRTALESRVDQWTHGLRPRPSWWTRLPASMVDVTGQQSRFEWLVGRAMLRAASRTGTAGRLGRLAPIGVLAMSPHWSREMVSAAAAIQQGIPTFAFVTSFDNLSTKRRVELPFDGWMVWSESQSRELRTYHPSVRSSQIAVVGAPQFDVFHEPTMCLTRQEWCEHLRLDASRGVVVFALGSPNLIDELPGAVEFVRRVRAGALGDVQVVVRPHPMFDDGRLRDAFGDVGGGVVVQSSPTAGLDITRRRQRRAEVIEWVSTFKHANLVINLSSTVTVDACVADTPVISLDFDPSPGAKLDGLVKSINRTWPHFAPVATSGGVRMVRDHDELMDAAQSYLAHPGRDSEGRRRVAELVCGHIDGRCGDRLADAFLERICSHRDRCDEVPA